MEIAVGSDLGIWQRHNNDAYLSELIAPGINFFGIADGFGTLGHGVPTAAVALETVRDYLRRRQRMGAGRGRATSPASVRALLLAALDHANARLFALGGSHEDYVGSGTSLTAVLVVGHHAFVGHVGDARAYLLRREHLESLTADDALFADVVASAKTSLPAKPRMQSVLWRSLGTQAKLEASIAHIELLAGDQLILCTDGVHRCLAPEEIGRALLESDSASEAVGRLLATTKTRGSLDNGTLIVGRDLLAAQSPPSNRATRLLSLRLMLGFFTLLMLALVMAMFVVHA
ncbi:MAG TPA: protein phosphatase 2C domain-containing protein [Candidatus Baltobacteraceae bacterium]